MIKMVMEPIILMISSLYKTMKYEITVKQKMYKNKTKKIVVIKIIIIIVILMA